MKKLNLFKLTVIVYLLMSLPIYGRAQGSSRKGGQGSGGGNAVVCFDNSDTAEKVKRQRNIVFDDDLNQVASVEALDLYEITKGRFKNTRTLFVSQAKDVDDFFDQLETYYKKVFYDELPVPAAVRRFEGFFAEIRRRIPHQYIHFVDNPVKYQDDSGETVDFAADRRCVLTTIIVQSGTDFEYGELTIDQRLFNHKLHSELSKAVFYLHEWLYRPLLVAKAPSSLQAQRIGQVLISKHNGGTIGRWFDEMKNYRSRAAWIQFDAVDSPFYMGNVRDQMRMSKGQARDLAKQIETDFLSINARLEMEAANWLNWDGVNPSPEVIAGQFRLIIDERGSLILRNLKQKMTWIPNSQNFVAVVKEEIDSWKKRVLTANFNMMAVSVVDTWVYVSLMPGPKGTLVQDPKVSCETHRNAQSARVCLRPIYNTPFHSFEDYLLSRIVGSRNDETGLILRSSLKAPMP